jgi:hypothetical protein
LKRYHLTSVLLLTGYRYQNAHADNTRTFAAIIGFMEEPPEAAEDDDEEEEDEPFKLRQMMPGDFPGVSKTDHKSINSFNRG